MQVTWREHEPFAAHEPSTEQILAGRSQMGACTLGLCAVPSRVRVQHLTVLLVCC